jgi:hypothetical protein
VTGAAAAGVLGCWDSSKAEVLTSHTFMMPWVPGAVWCSTHQRWCRLQSKWGRNAVLGVLSAFVPEMQMDPCSTRCWVFLQLGSCMHFGAPLPSVISLLPSKLSTRPCMGPGCAMSPMLDRGSQSRGHLIRPTTHSAVLYASQGALPPSFTDLCNTRASSMWSLLCCKLCG